VIRLPRLRITGKKLGASGEDLAAKHLRSQGYAILERNFRCPIGELDLVARKENLLVFAEVKTRRSEQYGPPQTAVTLRKRRRIVKLAHFYMKQKKLYHLQPRFDVIAIQWKDGGRPLINHISGAFLAE
jgi:putative endonuclease